MHPINSTLIIGNGNPSLGDDALGPIAVETLVDLAKLHPEWGHIETMSDFQLQIEWVMDIAEHQRIIFIDATASGAEPFSWDVIEAKSDASINTHALSPAGLLFVFCDFYRIFPPPCYLLGIRGYDFELGHCLSAQARYNLDAALAMLESWLTHYCITPCTNSL